MAQFRQLMIPTVKKIPLCKRDGILYHRKGPESEKIKQIGSVKAEKICQPVRTQQVCTEQKWFPCCLIGQLAMANAVKYVQKKQRETISAV